MAKKVRKPRSSSPRTYSQTGPAPSQAAAPTAVPTAGGRSSTAPAAASAKANQPVDLALEYSYVGKELKRLGLTAIALIALELVVNVVMKLVL